MNALGGDRGRQAEEPSHRIYRLVSPGTVDSHCSHSPSFDQRRRVPPWRTAMASAFRWGSGTDLVSPQRA